MWLFGAAAWAGPDTVLVSVDDVDHPPDVRALGGRLVRCFRTSRVCLVEGGSPDALARLPGVRRAEPDGVMTLASGVSAEPTDDCPNPYELALTEVEGAWAAVCGLDAPTIAIQDAGFRATHHDLAGQIADQYDYGDGDPVAEVSQASGVPEHGTFIAGVAAAVANDAGRTGLAPGGSLFLQKIADQWGALYYSYAIEAMDDLAANHPEVGVMNYSLASSSPPAAFTDAVEALAAADVVVVAAAANCVFQPDCFDADNDLTPVFPASYPFANVLAVASLREGGGLDPWSHFGGESVDVAAPGTSLCSLGIGSDDQVSVSSGTSYAAPVAAGVAALVRERWPRLDAADTVDVLVRSCTPDPQLADRVRCGGALSADRALKVPVVRFDPPTDVDAAPSAELVLTGDSRAAGGELFVQVTVPAGVTLDAAGGTSFAAGDSVPVPTGAEVADAPGVWLTVPLPEDGPVELRLPVEAVATDSGLAAVRLVPSGAGGVGVDARFEVAITSTAAEQEPPTPAPEQVTDGRVEPAGCGCGGGPRPVGWLVAAGVAAGRRRRR
ncbi:MAG: S8 family serine peptidase [Myxococcota bacterium]